MYWLNPKLRVSTDQGLVTGLNCQSSIGHYYLNSSPWVIILSVLETVEWLGLSWEAPTPSKLAWYIKIIVVCERLEKASLSCNKYKKSSWDETEANLRIC